MNTELDIPQTAPSTSEAGSLAHELAKVRNKLVAYYQGQGGQSIPEAVSNAEKLIAGADVEQILQLPIESTSWMNLEQLTAIDPEVAVQRWEDVKEAAYEEMANGHQAAKAVEVSEATCWKRAQFLALRDNLANEWRPRNGIEWALIDMMAQAMTLQTFWMRRLVMVDVIEWPDPSLEEMAKWQPPLLSSSMAIDQAAAMVDRFNRIFMRSLRQLRDLRRYTVVVQSAEQVNIGQQQVNVTNASDDSVGRGKPLGASPGTPKASVAEHASHRSEPRQRNRRKPK